jgi:hypothetical protein
VTVGVIFLSTGGAEGRLLWGILAVREMTCGMDLSGRADREQVEAGQRGEGRQMFLLDSIVDVGFSGHRLSFLVVRKGMSDYTVVSIL